MLLELHITDLALVEELHVSFGKGLLVFTGETGAGKSIILQAIALLSGRRASSSWVRTGCDKARVEALFSLPDTPELMAVLADMGIEHEGEIVIRRLLTKNGSRYHVNGQPSTARDVARISEFLVSVASQHDHQQLLHPRCHLDFVDLAGDLMDLRRKTADLHARRQALAAERDALRAREQDKEQRRDFLAFQCREINEAALAEGEDEELAVEQQRLKAADSLHALGKKCHGALTTAADHLARARKDIEQMAALDDSAGSVAAAVAEQSYLCEDHVGALREYLDALPHDMGRLDDINARISLIQQLKRKYGPTIADILAYGRQAQEELETLDAMDERLADLDERLARANEELYAVADELSQRRREVAARLGAALGAELAGLSLANAAFEIAVTGERGGIGPTGYDRVEFIFSANPGEPLQPLAKIASGGELSRLMLGLKCLFAQKDKVETVIFDEVDSGISGQAAEAVAAKIQELAGHHQVLCITHLPAIAARANEHFLVAKEVTGGRTMTGMRRLEDEERVGEIARMAGGDHASEKTRAFAAELISRGRRP